MANTQLNKYVIEYKYIIAIINTSLSYETVKV